MKIYIVTLEKGHFILRNVADIFNKLKSSVQYGLFFKEYSPWITKINGLGLYITEAFIKLHYIALVNLLLLFRRFFSMPYLETVSLEVEASNQ